MQDLRGYLKHHSGKDCVAACSQFSGAFAENKTIGIKDKIVIKLEKLR